MPGFEEVVNSGLGELGHASGGLGPGQAGTLISGSRRHVLLARSCGAGLEDHQSVFRTLWRVHRSWSLAIPAEFRTPVSHEIVWSVATSAWVHNVPRTFLLSFHCLLRPAEARQLPWWKLLMDHCRHVTNKFMESLTSEIPKRAGWQVMQPSNTCFWTVLESLNWSTP